MNKIILYCFNNKMHINYMNGCFSKLIVDEEDLNKVNYYDPKSKSNIEVYEYICTKCGKVSIIPINQVQTVENAQRLLLTK